MKQISILTWGNTVFDLLGFIFQFALKCIYSKFTLNLKTILPNKTKNIELLKSFISSIFLNEKLVLKKEFDSNFLLELIEFHRLEHLALEIIEVCNNKTFSIELKSRVQEKSLQNLQIAAVLIQVKSIFESIEIDFICLKGILLSEELFQDFSFRTCRDLDVLIHENDLEKAKNSLLQHGFLVLGADIKSPKQKQHFLKQKHHLNFIHEKSGIILELHWKLFPSHSNLEKFQNQIWNNLKDFQFKGHKFKALNDEFNFLFLCAHGSRHLWFRLFWLKDIQVFLEKKNTDFKKGLRILAQKYDLEKYLNQSLELLNLIENIKSNHDKNQKSKSFNMRIISDYSKEIQNNMIQKSRKHYTMIYFFEGKIGVLKEIIARRTKPENWSTFVFPDRFFFMNQLFSRSIWFIRKLKRK
jgi:hypothetical protein